MSLLDDYKRRVEWPRVKAYEAAIAAHREEIERLRAALHSAENSLDHDDIGTALAFIQGALKPSKRGP